MSLFRVTILEGVRREYFFKKTESDDDLLEEEVYDLHDRIVQSGTTLEGVVRIESIKYVPEHKIKHIESSFEVEHVS